MSLTPPSPARADRRTDGLLQLALSAVVVLLAITLVRVAVTRFGYQPTLDRLHTAQAAQSQADRAMTQMQEGVRAFQLSADERLLAPYSDGLGAYSRAARTAASDVATVPGPARAWSAADATALAWQQQYAAKAVSAVRAGAPRPSLVSLLSGQSRFDRWTAARASASLSLIRATHAQQLRENAFRNATSALQVTALAVVGLALLRRMRRTVPKPAAAAFAAAGPGGDWQNPFGDAGTATATEALAMSITRGAREISGATGAHLWLANDDGELRRIDPGRPVIVAQRRRNDVTLRAHREGAIITTVTRSRRLVAVPLLHEGRARGVVELTMPSGAGEPSSAQTEMLRAWGRQAAKAVAFGPAAGRDPLTGLAARPQLLVDVTAAVEAGLGRGRPVSLVVLKVDHLDRHTTGGSSHDDLVRTVGAVLSDTVRTSDTAYRVDDEAFAILLPGATAHAATSLAERLRQIVARRFVERGVTASFGVATCPDTADSDRRLIEAAESALYDAQRFGGNRAQAALALADELALSQHRTTDPG